MAQTSNSRILLVPSSPDLGVSVIKRITKADEGADQQRVNWNISNKYYTALVHFHRAAWRDLVASMEPGIPAVLVVWEKGEDYEYIIGRYAAEWETLKPEVMLAVAVGHGELDTEAADDFCSEVGFEFVDAGDNEDGDLENTGWNRVVEALQTVMWPSMQMKPTRPTHRSQLSMERAKQLSSEPPREDAKPKPGDSGDAWPQPTQATTATAGFDDDFADFVSAPTPVDTTTIASSNSKAADVPPSKESGLETAQPEEEHEVVDFQTAEDEDYKELLDEDMPSTDEILLTSQRIFGQSLAAPDGGEDDEGDMGEFDLGSIMGALQSMKDEIAGMTNEEEKRKAAARVALGLVWGLEGGRGM